MKIHKSTARLSMAYLRKTPANSVTNNLSIKDASGVTMAVRGFMGVKSSSTKVVKGALCWGSGSSLNTIVFHIHPIPKRMKVLFPDVPAGMTAVEATTIVRNFIDGMTNVLRDKFIKKALKIRGGGRKNGYRLEGWKRKEKPAVDHFPTAIGQRFTQRFAELANEMSVYYR